MVVLAFAVVAVVVVDIMSVVTCAAVEIVVVVGVVVSDCAVGSVVGNNAMTVNKSDITSSIARFCGCAAILLLPFLVLVVIFVVVVSVFGYAVNSVVDSSVVGC